MHKYEQKFCSELNKWLNHYGKEIIGDSCPIEVKISTETKPINFKSGFRPQQLPTLLQAKNEVYSYKISDMDRMPKPYDIAFYCKAPSLIAIMWIRKGNKQFYFIEPEAIEDLKALGQKSLDEKTAMVIAKYVCKLK